MGEYQRHDGLDELCVGAVMRRFIFGALIALCLIAPTLSKAQTFVPAAPTYTLQLSEQQITGIVDAGVACLEKMPMACARYVLYIHDLLITAKQPKPEPKKEP